jgi:hypothetical protein
MLDKTTKLEITDYLTAENIGIGLGLIAYGALLFVMFVGYFGISTTFWHP